MTKLFSSPHFIDLIIWPSTVLEAIGLILLQSSGPVRDAQI